MALFAGLNAQGITVVIVTHEPSVAAAAKRVVTFRDGRIVGDSTSNRGEPVPSIRERLAS
jgi:putative ABC transport system ATP-binding protein